MADVSGDRPWYEELAPDLEGDAGRGVEGSRVDSRRRVMAVWRGFEDSRAGVWLAEHTRLLAGLSSEGSVLVRRLAVGVLLVAMAFTLLLFAAAGGDPVAGGLLSMPFWMAALAACAVLWAFWDAYRDSGERLVDRLSSAPGMATRRQVAAACGVREVMRTMVPSVLPAMLAAAMRERRMGGDPVWPRPWQAAMYVGECHHVGVWLSLEMHAYVLGPTRSGKTVTVVIPRWWRRPASCWPRRRAATSSRRPAACGRGVWRIRRPGPGTAAVAVSISSTRKGWARRTR